ncbi:MAG: YbjQ family protein [Lachnospiraceae bacterium]|nr:YbjQ family protein [Lachnospiraceae bacterium]
MELKDIISLSFNVGVPILLLGTTWITQSEIIRARRKYLSEQEEYYRKKIPMTNLKRVPAGTYCAPTLVTGSVVIATNYFISFISSFKHLFGGEMKGYTGMCSDARRMALVRMLQDAEHVGANAVYNVRFETSTVNSGEKRKSSGGVELIAYGTAVRRTNP